MEPPSFPKFIISCEHADYRVPDPYLYLFDGAGEVLRSHYGWDSGALELAHTLSQKTGSQLFFYRWTRLLVDPNRSVGHPKLFSEYTKKLPEDEKQTLIKTYYQSYRNEIIKTSRKWISENKMIIHIGVHTFTPVFDGKERNVEIGLLYDPARILEKKFCINWKIILKESLPQFLIRMNQPYKGASDGMTTSLRKMFDEKLYLGIEIEINQKLIHRGFDDWNKCCSKLGDTLLKLQRKMK